MDQRKELSLIVGCSDVRAHNDGVDKACYILMNYEGDTKITKNRLSNYFGFTPSLLWKRLWSTLLGYTDHSQSKPTYLAPVHEAHLASTLDLENSKLNSIDVNEFKEMVM